MNLQEFEETLPPGSATPPALAKLITYADDVQSYFSPGFELMENSKSTLNAWFRNKRPHDDRFVIFGTGPDGSAYAFWSHDGRPIADAPVVMLGGDGEAGVIADTFEDFLRLLALGVNEAGYLAVVGDDLARVDAFDDEDDEETVETFRAWLAREFGLEPPANGRDLVAKGRERHPNLEEWLRERVG